MDDDNNIEKSSDKEISVCEYCNRSCNEYVLTNCCHTITQFVHTLNTLKDVQFKMMDDFLRSQPALLVMDAIQNNRHRNGHALKPLPIDFYKLKEIVLYELYIYEIP